MMTKGEIDEYVKVTGKTEEEAKKEYDAMTGAMMEALGGEGVSEEVQTRFRDTYVKILAKSKYTVKEAEETKDGGYKVDVVIEPITGLYDGISDELQQEASDYVSSKIAAGEQIDQAGITDWVFNILIDKLESRIDSLTYGEPQTVTVEIKKENDKYMIANESEVGQEIGAALIDTSGLQ